MPSAALRCPAQGGVIFYFIWQLLRAVRTKADRCDSRDFDAVQKCEAKSGDPVTSIIWADEFQKYMTNLLTTNQALLQAKIKDIESKILAQPDKLVKQNGEPNGYAIALKALQSQYPATALVFKTNDLLKFPVQELGIRDTPASNCSVPTTSVACVVVTYVSFLSQLLLL